MTKMTILVANTDALLGSAFWDSVMMHMLVSTFHSVSRQRKKPVCVLKKKNTART
jgi:hypothetical protein